MNELISPKYSMLLAKSVEKAIWDEFKSYKDVLFYIEKWHEGDYYNWENFSIAVKANKDIDLPRTLNNMQGQLLLKVAIDLGVDTPDFIPSIPTFKNDLKSNYKTAHGIFVKAFKQIESDPSLAIGLANSALESIIKEILKDDRFTNKCTGKETLYSLAIIILKEFNFHNNAFPKEIKTIGNQLASICQSIEKLRSEKTTFHGKTETDILITDSLYAYFVVNSVTTLGLFLNSFYKLKFPKQTQEVIFVDDLPF